jgi:hypothetical protein
VPNVPAVAREQMIKNLDRQIEQLKPQAANNPSAQRIVDLLQDRKQELEKQIQSEKAEAKPAEPAPAELPAESSDK